MKHLLATMSSHLRHKLPELKVKIAYLDGTFEEKYHPFMDGFYLSNTPLREYCRHTEIFMVNHQLKEHVFPLEI